MPDNSAVSTKKIFCADEFLNILGNKVWIQGIITKTDPEATIIWVDDGTKVVRVFTLQFSIPHNRIPTYFTPGQYVLVQGNVTTSDDNNDRIIDCRTIAIMDDPNMETLWNLEVIECF